MFTEEEQRLKKKYNRLLRRHRDMKLAVLEYAVKGGDDALLALLSKH